MSSDNVTPQQAVEMLRQSEAVLIDVRNADEFAANHIADAVSLPLGQIAETFSLLNISSDKKIIFQCAKGGRGQKALDLVNAKKLTGGQLYNLAGGISAWQSAGLPVISASKKQTISIFRQVQIVVGTLIALFVALGFMGCTTSFAIAGLLGLALLFAGITGWCGMAIFLSKMPWNKP